LAKRYINTSEVHQMALTWESFPDGNFKYMWRSQYGTTTFALDIHALTAALL
jgi:hypothetical protein